MPAGDSALTGVQAMNIFSHDNESNRNVRRLLRERIAQERRRVRHARRNRKLAWLLDAARA